jgi:hypothetical protein
MMKRNIWCKAAASSNEGQCVEVKMTDDAVLVRDTKDEGQGPIHTYTYAEWIAFLDGVSKGEFDLS